MKKFTKYNVMLIVSMIMFTSPAFSWYCKTYQQKFECTPSTTNLTLQEVPNKVVKSAATTEESVTKAANATQANVKKQTVSDDKKEGRVPRLIPGVMAAPNNHPLIRMTKESGPAPNPGGGISHDTSASLNTQISYVNGNSNTYLSNREKYFIHAILEAAHINYGVLDQLIKAKLLANKIKEESENDDNLSENHDFNASLERLNTVILHHINLVEAATSKLESFETMYTSPDLGSDPSSLSKLGEGSATPKAAN